MSGAAFFCVKTHPSDRRHHAAPREPNDDRCRWGLCHQPSFANSTASKNAVAMFKPKRAPKIGASMTQSSRLLLGSKGSVSPLRLPDPSTRDVAHARCTFVCWVAHGSCSLPSRLMHQMVCPNLIVEGLWPSLWDRSNNKSEYIQSNKNKNIHMNFPKMGCIHLYTSNSWPFDAIWFSKIWMTNAWLSYWTDLGAIVLRNIEHHWARAKVGIFGVRQTVYWRTYHDLIYMALSKSGVP